MSEQYCFVVVCKVQLNERRAEKQASYPGLNEQSVYVLCTAEALWECSACVKSVGPTVVSVSFVSISFTMTS